MSKTLYIQNPGKNVRRLNFTIDDLPIIAQWYEYAFRNVIEKPAFKELGVRMINYFSGTRSFKIYRMAYRYIRFKTKIKNFFRWKRTLLND